MITQLIFGFRDNKNAKDRAFTYHNVENHIMPEISIRDIVYPNFHMRFCILKFYVTVEVI